MSLEDRALAASVRRQGWLMAAFFLLSVGMALPGITLGVPAVWNPDELVRRVGLALTHDDWGFFDRTNFDYPSLPKYVMYAIGRITYFLGGDFAAYVVTARLFSAVLGGGIVVLTYTIAQSAGAGLYARVMAALLTLFASQLVANAHWAHNDLYLVFFTTLSAYLLIRFQLTAAVRWLYFAFFAIGLAASSKYNGVVLLPAPVILFALLRQRHFWIDWRGSLRTCTIGVLLAGVAYALGTPRALLSPSSYLPVVAAALLDLRVSAPPGLAIGALGQWRFMIQAFGEPTFVLFVAGFIWALHTITSGRGEVRGGTVQGALRVLLVCIVVFNSPFWFSYNYQERYFLPFLPWLSVVAALGLGLLRERLRPNRILSGALIGASGALIAHSLMRAISVDMLFIHDARIAANESMAAQRDDDGVGYGGRHLLSEKVPSWRRIGPFPDPAGRVPVPKVMASPHDDAVTGEADFVRQCATFYVVDSFTADSFVMPSVCGNYPAECEFIRRLRAGQSRYKLVRTFAYRLPVYLPSLRIDFVNPTMSVFRLEQDAASLGQCRGQAWRRSFALETHNGSVAHLQYPGDEPKRVRVSIPALGGRASWDVVLNEVSARTISGHAYVLTFQARADRARQMACAVGRNRPPWNALGLYTLVDVAAEWRTYRFAFVATETEADARTYFNLGGSDAAVELADVTLQDLSADREFLSGGATR